MAVNAPQITGNNGKQNGVSELSLSPYNPNHCEDQISGINQESRAKEGSMVFKKPDNGTTDRCGRIAAIA